MPALKQLTLSQSIEYLFSNLSVIIINLVEYNLINFTGVHVKFNKIILFLNHDGWCLW